MVLVPVPQSSTELRHEESVSKEELHDHPSRMILMPAMALWIRPHFVSEEGRSYIGVRRICNAQKDDNTWTPSCLSTDFLPGIATVVERKVHELHPYDGLWGTFFYPIVPTFLA
mmetsp:Transcript_6106/g.21564  ORF Transcript_6106/g.21564 Transcript_6106/m.21564 type:complete len:114 (-) Transcript_6106:250-591(-)